MDASSRLDWQPDHQHVELLDDEVKLKFIAWTGTDLKPMDSLCFINPVTGLRLAQHLGLDTVGYKMFPMDQLDDRVAIIRNTYGKVHSALMRVHSFIMGRRAMYSTFSTVMKMLSVC